MKCATEGVCPCVRRSPRKQKTQKLTEGSHEGGEEKLFSLCTEKDKTTKTLRDHVKLQKIQVCNKNNMEPAATIN